MDGVPHIVVGRARFKRFRGAAIVGGEGDVGPVRQTAGDQPGQDDVVGEGPELGKDAALQPVPRLLQRPDLMVGGNA